MPFTAFWPKERARPERSCRGHDTRSRDDSAGQDEVLLLTEDGRYRHVPIVNGSKVVGVVSRFGLGEIELDRLDGETGLWERI